MKRALILALAVLALALYAVLRPGATDPDRLALPAATESAAETSRTAELEAAAANGEPSRASLVPGALQSEATPLSETHSGLVRIRVRDSDSNAPVRGAAVELEPAPEGSRTDERGEVELRLPIGAQLKVLHVRPAGGSESFVPYEHNIDEPLSAAGTVLDVRVDRGRALRGLVLEDATGRPIEGAHVTYLGLGGRPEAKTREDGSFELAGIHAGRWTAPGRVSVEHPLYIRTEVRPASSDLAPDATPLRILLRSGLCISGRIVDSERAPVAGALVLFTASGQGQVSSDELGRFEIGGLDRADEATLIVPTQALAQRAILGTSKDLGALEASRLDLELEVRSALTLQVYAELADGTRLGRQQFELDCPGGAFEERSAWSGAHFNYDPLFEERILPFGPAIELEVFASAYDPDDPSLMLRGRASVHPEPGLASPHAVHVVLSERHRLEIPPAPPNAQEHVLDHRGVPRGAFDAQLIDDSSGNPIEGGRFVTLRFGGETVPLLVQDRAWLRLRAAPGTQSVELRYGAGPFERFTFTIPWSGHAQAVWRLRSKP